MKLFNGKPITLRQYARFALLATAVSWILFIWPTPYRFLKSGNVNYRVNRFTGTTEILSDWGWYQRHDEP